MADAPIYSRPISQVFGCERCIFGRGEHSADCSNAKFWRDMEERLSKVGQRPNRYLVETADGNIRWRPRGAPEPKSFVAF